MCTNCKEQNNSASGFILGAALGAAVALMFAPFSGKKMRRLTKEKGKEKFVELKGKYDEFEKDSIKPNLKKAKDKTKGFWNKTKDEVRDTKEDIKDDLKEVGEKIAQKTDEVKNRVRSVRIKTEE